MGNLWAANRIASLAKFNSTPPNSNNTFPGFTTATQWSGAPFPLPILVSAGFLVADLSGNILTQTFPPLFMAWVMATRAASIWALVIQ